MDFRQSSLDQLLRVAHARLAMDGIGDELADTVESERRQHYLLIRPPALRIVPSVRRSE
jgi:hypothetical protein